MSDTAATNPLHLRRITAWNYHMHRILLMVALAAGSFSLARAQSPVSPLWKWCEGGESISRDWQIGACTTIIRSEGQSNKTLATAYFNRGYAQKGKGQNDNAIEDYDWALRLTPNDPDIYVQRGVAYRNKGDYDHAFADYANALRLDPKNSGAFDSRCYAYAILNELEKALEDCNASLQLFPNAAYTLDSRGFIYLKMGRFNEAVADYDAALKLYPKLVESLYGRGLAKMKLGDVTGNTDISAAKLIEPNIADLMARMGMNPP
jgi:tetratricopeptide (TPR) repeat protein